MQQHWVPSFTLIMALLVTAAIVVIVIAVALSAGDPETRGDEVADDDTTQQANDDEAGDASDPADPPNGAGPTGVAEIATVEAFDPDGDGGGENDELAAFALAGSASDDGWPTLCYSSRFMGGKRGVGLVVTFTTASTGVLSVSSLNAPYQLEVFATDRESPPDDPDRWGDSLTGTVFDVRPGRVETELPAGTRHALVWLMELGTDDACSEARPYRGRLGNLTFTPVG